MNSAPLVYILILNFNSLEDTLKCFKEVKKIDYPNFRVLVIDNNSPDGSGEALKQLIDSDEFLSLSKNHGYAGGNNIAIKLAFKDGADYILIVNPDIRLPENTLTEYIKIMQSDKNIAGLNAIQLQANGEHFDSNFLSGVLQPCGFNGDTLEKSQLPELFDSEVIFGASLMLSAEAIKKVGGFDPLYFAYGEEIDLCRRLRMHNYRLVVTTKAPAIHLRTIYTKPLSRHILFLRLKGYYLSRLKKPSDSLSRAAKYVYREIKTALTGRAESLYPYDTYPYDKIIIIKTALWLIAFMPCIYLHKRQEKTLGFWYLK